MDDMSPSKQPSALDEKTLLQLTVVQLRRELAVHGAPVGGRKPQLQQRLLAIVTADDSKQRDALSSSTHASHETAERNSVVDSELAGKETPSGADHHFPETEVGHPIERTAVCPNPTDDQTAPVPGNDETGVPVPPRLALEPKTSATRKRRWQDAGGDEPASKRTLTEPTPPPREPEHPLKVAGIAVAKTESSAGAKTIALPNNANTIRAPKPEHEPNVFSPSRQRTPYTLLDHCIAEASPCLVSCRHNKKLYGTLRAYDKHFNLLMEHVREIWQEHTPDQRMDLRERFIPRLFVRGDGVIFIVRPALSNVAAGQNQ
jgi:small nuclear ribonucleoprotein D2